MQPNILLSVPKAIWLEFEKYQQRPKRSNRSEEDDGVEKQVKQMLHYKTLNLSQNGLQTSLQQLGPEHVSVERKPPLQLPIRIYLCINDKKFEAIVYDMDDYQGRRYIRICDPITNAVKRPRARTFARIVKVPPEPEYAKSMDLLYSNLSMAAKGCQWTTANGWIAWTVKIPGDGSNPDRYTSVCNFRGPEEKDDPEEAHKCTGSGFIPSPNASARFRELMARHCVGEKPGDGDKAVLQSVYSRITGDKVV